MLRNPDIQRLLANLRGATVDKPHPDSSPADSLERDSQHSGHHGSLHDDRNKSSQDKSQQASMTHPNRSSTPITLDASVISTWPAAIKYISKQVATNEVLEAKIKRLISEQHKHERDWWAKREAVVNRHAGRAGNQQKAAELLRSLGGQYIPVTPADPQTDGAELEAFDAKVHKSLTQLTTHYDRELRQMGIPFFAIKHDLVILEEGKEREGMRKGRLDRGELRQLQVRMLVYLEELFGEE